MNNLTTDAAKEFLERSDTQVAYDALVQEAEATKRENRIEALRAASRIVAGLLTDSVVARMASIGSAAETTVDIAEQLVRFIEKGERDG